MAGLGGAGLNGLGEGAAGGSGPEKAGHGSRGAQAQYAALASLRWHMFTNGLRSNLGVFELGARTIAYVLYAAMGLGLGAGAGAAAFLLASHDSWRYLPVVFWVLFLLWQVVPVMLASFHEQFDLGILLRFPVSFGSYYLLYLIFGLADISSVLGGLCCLGVLIGITVTRPELFAWTALALAFFAGFNILMVRAIFSWIDRWLAQRKTREILGAVFLVLMMSMQLLNPAFHRMRHQERMGRRQEGESYRRVMVEAEPWLKTASAVQKWLPPGLAEGVLQHPAEHEPGAALESLGLLGIYMLAAGGVLGLRLRAEYRGESLGQAPGRKAKAAAVIRTAGSQRNAALSQARATLDPPGGAAHRTGRFPDSAGPIAAVMEKELRALLRTLPLLYAIGAPLLLVLIFSGIFIKNSPQAHVYPLAVPICMVYAQIGFTQLFYNNLGAEGAGIQLYFLSPTPIRTVVLAKNLFHALMFGIAALAAATLASLRLGTPSGEVLAATGAWLLFSLPCNLAAGDVFSLTMPYRINPGRISGRRGSQANALLSLLVQLAVVAVSAAVIGLCSFAGRLWLAVPIFLVLAAGAVLVWVRVLRNADGLANRRRDTLMAILMKTE